jgi:hypothetical protein
MRLLLVSFIIFFMLFSPVFAKSATTVSSNTPLNCNYSYSFSINGIICSLGYIIDQFTEFTPNILSSSGFGGNLAGIAYNQYVNGTEALSLAIIPLIIYIYVMHLIGEASIGGTRFSPIDLLYNVIIAVIILFLSVYIISFFITFINVMDKFIVQHIILSSNPSLFQTIVNSISLDRFSGGIFSGITIFILYIFLIIALFIFSFQFILRFILLWIFILLFPFAVIVSIYPPFNGVLKVIFSKIAELLFVQPAFLIGVSVFIIIVRDFAINPIEKFILAIITLFALSLIPTLLARYLNFSLSSGYTKVRRSINKIKYS